MNKTHRASRRAARGAALGALALATGAHGAAGLGDQGTYQPTGAEFCSTADDGAAVSDASVWTCLVPNGSGGLALVSNVPTKAGTGYPDTATLKTLYASGAKAIVIGDASAFAAGANSLSIGNNARVTAPATDGIAIGTNARVQGAGSFRGDRAQRADTGRGRRDQCSGHWLRRARLRRGRRDRHLG